MLVMEKWKFYIILICLLARAQSLCLIGPNGAGKSTILHSIYGFTNIFSGKIEIEEKEITNLSPAQKIKIRGNSLYFTR